ncbi:ArpU family phage packaging/lysis transcriptional regulator [Lacticaseibacillus sharpeae]|uniref:ArpU family phage packaging/lysis transcriptional regulator n=1 Tax=Lacticaseibacillus sharpeae TaxID=1626 RepID=UPI000704954F|nr:ArpU family phage packaging/lysis transcriptional regulator [Lacticaseibacillus sharpeae]
MELLPIDEKKSRAAAEEVLEQYREKRAIVRMPAMPKLTSSWGDGTANSTAPRSPYAQQLLEDRERARGFCSWVEASIDHLPRELHQRLLLARYVDGSETQHPDLTAMDVLDISSSHYFRIKAQALLAVSYYLGLQRDSKN